jgi:hypothetical protein
VAIRWSKLLMNAIFSDVSTALACTFEDVWESPEAMGFLARIADELVRVANASGHHLARMQREDIDSLRLALAAATCPLAVRQFGFTFTFKGHQCQRPRWRMVLFSIHLSWPADRTV